MTSGTQTPTAPKARIKTERRRRKPGGGGEGGGQGGGNGGRRPRIPELPKGDDLGDLLQFTVMLLRVWVRRVSDPEAREFPDLSAREKQLLLAGWQTFERQWHQHGKTVFAAAESVSREELELRGLSGELNEMKREFVRKWAARLQEAYTTGKEWLQIRPLWKKTFETTDVILDSAERALAPVPVVGAIISSLKEFKDTAMSASEVLDSPAE